MLEVMKKLFRLLSPHERRRFYATVVLAIASGLFEMVGVASVLPFLAVLSDPGRIERPGLLNRIYDGLGFSTHENFMIFLGLGVLGLILLSLCVRLTAIYAISRFANMRTYSLSRQLIENYLRQPYIWFLRRNSAQLSKTILIEVQRVVNQAIIPVMMTISQFALVLSLFGLLLYMEPAIALIAVALFGGSYVLVFIVARRILARIGDVILQSNNARFKSVHEVMSSIKDVKILGVERPFIKRFCEPTHKMAVVQSTGAVISEAPRYFLEALALGGMLVLILYLLLSRSGTLVDVLPTLGIFAFAGMRLFPALQAIYRELGKLKISKPAVDELYADMMETRARTTAPWSARPDGHGSQRGLPLNDRIELDGISYAYPEANRTALRSLGLEIPARRTLGIVGGTGAGKTTLVDVMLGLLSPEEGSLFVGGVNQPNIDALDWLLAEIWPAVRRRRPEARLRVVGRVAERAGVPWPEGAEAVGFVEDLAPEYAGAAATLAPIRFGSGVKIKLVEGLAQGLPGIATPVGAEGLVDLPPRVLRIAGTAEAFADALAAVLDDPDPGGARAAARTAVAAHYAREAVARRLAADLARVRGTSSS